MSAPAGGRIIVGVDGSENSRRALGFVAELAAATGWDVVAVHAVGLLAARQEAGPAPAHHELEQLRQVFTEQWCEPLRAAGVNYQCLQVEGGPVDALLRLGTEVGATVCVVGRRGNRPHAELVLGSTSLQLAESSSIPVMVVPPGGPGADADPPRREP